MYTLSSNGLPNRHLTMSGIVSVAEACMYRDNHTLSFSALKFK